MTGAVYRRVAGKYSHTLAWIIIATIVALSVSLLLARPTAAAQEGTWNWLVTTKPGDTSTPLPYTGISDDGQVIATVVGSNAPYEVRITRDGGTSWSTKTLDTDAVPVRVSVSPDGQRIGIYGYNTTDSTTWLLLSTDQGVSFAPTTGALPTSNVYFLLNPFVVHSDRLFFQLLRYETVGGVLTYFSDLYVSTDDGATWVLRSTRALGDSTYVYLWSTGSLGISGSGQHLVAGAKTGLVISGDSGASWSDIALSSIDPSLDPASTQFYGASISDTGQDIVASYITTNGGSGSALYVSHDGGTTWEKHDSKLAMLAYGTSTSAVSRDGTAILALDMSDCDTVSGTCELRTVISRDGGTTWEQLDNYGMLDSSATSFPSLSGDGRTVFISDLGGEGGTLRLIAGRWTPVEVEDVIETPQREDGQAPLAPNTGVASSSSHAPILILAVLGLGALATLIGGGHWITGRWK